MRGRRPKPTALKLIEGNPGKRPLPKDEPTPPVGATKPKGLGAVASRKWDELAPLLTESRILTVVDAGALEAYCVAYEEYELAGQEIEETGLTIHEPVRRHGREPLRCDSPKGIERDAAMGDRARHDPRLTVSCDQGRTAHAREQVRRDRYGPRPEPALANGAGSRNH